MQKSLSIYFLHCTHNWASKGVRFYWAIIFNSTVTPGISIDLWKCSATDCNSELMEFIKMEKAYRVVVCYIIFYLGRRTSGW